MASYWLCFPCAAGLSSLVWFNRNNFFILLCFCYIYRLLLDVNAATLHKGINIDNVTSEMGNDTQGKNANPKGIEVLSVPVGLCTHQRILSPSQRTASLNLLILSWSTNTSVILILGHLEKSAGIRPNDGILCIDL